MTADGLTATLGSGAVLVQREGSEVWHLGAPSLFRAGGFTHCGLDFYSTDRAYGFTMRGWDTWRLCGTCRRKIFKRFAARPR